MNVFTFTGNLGKDADQRHMTNGDSIVSFSVAVKSGYGKSAKTTWVKCSMFGKRGESVLPYLVKGQLVGVSGEFSVNEWENKDGQKQTTPEVRVNDLTLLGKKETEQNERNNAPTQAQKTVDSEDIPF
jgi:single-strand DNA-binding protein